MGRAQRHDVDYFPFIVKDGKTLFILEAKYECKGTGFFTNVMRFLAKQTDHHYQVSSEADRLFFYAKLKCDPEAAKDMLSLMVTTGKLDRELYDLGVIACEDFLINIQDAYSKRKNDCITMNQIRQIYGLEPKSNPVKTKDQKTENSPGKEINSPGKDHKPDSIEISGASKPQTIVKDTRLEKNTAEAVTSSRHFQGIVGEFFDGIYVACETIGTYKPKGKKFNPYQWVQMQCNHGIHPGAINETISALAQRHIWDGIQKGAYAYANSIIKTKHQNWNEKDAVAIHEEMKAWEPDILAELTKGIMKRMD